MSFSSFEFLVFLGVVLGLYVQMSHRAQNRMLLVASYIFYGWWDWRFLSLIVFSTIVDFSVGQAISRTNDERRRWNLLLLSVLVNLSLLGGFKYAGFFGRSFADMLKMFGMQADYATLHIVLPVGISFYTFQTMSYTIDVYRRKMEPTSNFLDFALFVSFFPQLVAGPIERASTLLPQIIQPRVMNYDAFTRGVFLLLFGLFKKIVIADGVSRTVDALFNTSSTISWTDLSMGTVLFAIQIYCDFSGYSDVARGVAKMLGFNLMKNFNVPYASSNPQEFWHRWHISLSTWLRDYLYIPLGGSRFGSLFTYRNLMITMVLGGLWHGAAWNFVLWGAYQGVLLCGHRILFGTHRTTSTDKTLLGTIQRLINIGLFFVLTCYGWLLFRAESFEQIVQFTHILLFDFGDFARHLPPPTFAAIPGICLLFVMDCFQFATGKAQFYRSWPEPVRGMLFAVMLFLLAMGAGNQPTQFIYFQF